MAQIIEIEGGIARVVTRQIEYEVPLNRLDAQLTVAKPSVSPILPKGTIAVREDPDNNTVSFLIERAPRVETITISLLRPDDNAHAYEEQHYLDEGTLLDPYQVRLALPWEYYLFTGNTEPANVDGESYISLEEAYLYWSPSKIKRHGHTLYAARLPNVESSGLICWGSTTSNNLSLASKIDEMINLFYVSPFNEDYGHLDFPAPLSRLENMELDSTGIPYWEWNDFEQVRWNWPSDYDINASRQLRAIPNVWTNQGIRDWWASLTPTRQAFITRLASVNTEPTLAATPAFPGNTIDVSA